MKVGNYSVEEVIPRPLTEEDCIKKYQDKHPTNVNQTLNSGLYCNAAWDEFYCWPPTPAGQVTSRTCAEIFETYHVPVHAESNGKIGAAYRVCEKDATWRWGNWTNYTECVGLLNEDSTSAPLAVGYILFICSVLSLIALVVTLFIFCYFKSLHCQRLRVHQNLVVALILHSVLLIAISSPMVLSDALSTYADIGDIDWLCKTILSLKMYAAMASVNWMFVEGLLLHSRITVSVFQQEAPFRIYYLIGWGLPLVFILTWCLLMSRDLHSMCWKGYGDSDFVWVLTGPMLLVLLVNTFFMVNIIRILVTKLRASASVETAQVRKAIKATALLFPLLGVTYLLFAINPGHELEQTYMITNAIFQSSQGLFLAVLYCFTNSEVQTALRNAYLRFRLQRSTKRYSSTGSAVSGAQGTFLALSNYESEPESSRLKISPFSKNILPLRSCQETEACIAKKDNGEQSNHYRSFQNPIL
ncbi:corticotropin-releasing factor receptor 1-like [Limulus polyphemus]|uniref:Corticotropin-releasing factor receptor 1-like n=1 Tax=Limulus polyphemus TaxID=6850 RepID=A0ABM1S6I1_LIMPO|nr:corticotropin-releasing factor receptor 1-like [Limulus polyphemus]